MPSDNLNDVINGLRSQYNDRGGDFEWTGNSLFVDPASAEADALNKIPDLIQWVAVHKGINIVRGDVDVRHATVNHWQVVPIPFNGTQNLPLPNTYLGYVSWLPHGARHAKAEPSPVDGPKSIDLTLFLLAAQVEDLQLRLAALEGDRAPKEAKARLSHHRRPLAGEYNTAFLTDDQLRDLSWSVQMVRSFLASYGGYFQGVVKDTDGSDFDLADVLYSASITYHISPKVLLTTLQKESSGVTRTDSPNLGALMGNAGGSSARQQVMEAGRLFDAYQNEITSTGSTRSGWSVGTAKMTTDGVSVTPATNAVAGQFTYTPVAGDGWGGSGGGVYLFYSSWKTFNF
jgi:hypothetical protein